MWRAFFYATGIMMIILGIECIVVGRFRISPEAGMTRAIKKVWGNVGIDPIASAESDVSPANGIGTRPSQFGPSKFRDDPFFNVSNDNRQRSGSPFSLAGGGSSSSPMVSSRSRVVQTEDWMPWSLIAAGAIITIYTQTLHRSGEQT